MDALFVVVRLKWPARWAAGMLDTGRLVGMDPLVVLAEQIAAIVVTVRNAHDRVNVAFGRLTVAEPHAAMMIKLCH